MNFGINLINPDHYAKTSLSLSILVLEKQLHEKLAVEMKATLDKTDSSKLQSKSWKIIESKL